jgi:hypothetical protein
VPGCSGGNDEGVADGRRVGGHAAQKLSIGGVDVEPWGCGVALRLSDEPLATAYGFDIGPLVGEGTMSQPWTRSRSGAVRWRG